VIVWISTGIALAGVLIGGASLLISTRNARRAEERSASSEWVDQLEKRVALCESDRERLHLELERVRGELGDVRTQNFELMSRLLEAGA
jgi:hypothetical protein